MMKLADDRPRNIDFDIYLQRKNLGILLQNKLWDALYLTQILMCQEIRPSVGYAFFKKRKKWRILGEVTVLESIQPILDKWT